MTSKLWTEKETAILKQMIAAACDAGKITKVLKSRSICAIKHKAEQLGLSLVSKPEIDFEAFKKIMRTKERTI
jgi:hypothetical protein